MKISWNRAHDTKRETLLWPILNDCITGIPINHDDSYKSRIISRYNPRLWRIICTYTFALTRRKTWPVCYMVSHWRAFQRRERWSRKAPDQIWARTCVHTAVYHSGCNERCGKRQKPRFTPLTRLLLCYPEFHELAPVAPQRFRYLAQTICPQRLFVRW